MFQTTGVLNFAYGAMGAVAAFTFATLSVEHSPWTAFVVCVVAAPVAGAALGLVSLPAQRSTVPVKAIATVSLALTLQGAITLVWGVTPRRTPVLSNEAAFEISGVVLSNQQVATLAIALATCVAIAAFFRFGRLGSALRAMAADVLVAQLIGLPVRTLWVVSWAIAAVSAALGGILVLPATSLSAPNLTFIVLTPLAAALIAGFRSPTIAVASAFAIGVLQGVSSGIDGVTNQFFGLDWDLSAYRDALPLAIALLVLLVLPASRVATWERV